MKKSMAIIGAGMGGLAAGIYGQANGYDTEIFELHSVPGGQCCAWKRKGYTFDGCIHHLFGCSPATKLNSLWRELGAMPRELAPTRECVSVANPQGKSFLDYWDLEELEHHLKELSPGDAAVVDDYIKGIKAFSRSDLWGEMMMGSVADLAKALPGILSAARWFRPDMRRYAERFNDAFLARAFRLLEYSIPEIPLMLHLSKHAYGLQGDIAWPVGGSLEFAKSMEQRYLELGGVVHYKSRAERILTSGNRAVGVRLEDGSEHRADMVVSNADGRRTILDMLEGRYISERIRGWCAEDDAETPWAVHVFLGVDRDLSCEPSALVMLLDQPVTIAGHTADSLEMQIFDSDMGMAPQGKGVIKVELVSSYPYWKRLAEDRHRYDEEKEKVADTVISILERELFPGIRQQVEAIDVPTLLTWERYMGGTHGFQNMPVKKQNFYAAFLGRYFSTLPGLENFYMVGVWATMGGALFFNAISGRKLVNHLCKQDGKRFEIPAGA
jgi:phytoene dehydrogenase-like protein